MLGVVDPRRVHALHELEFLHPGPALDLFFPSDCDGRIAEGLVVHEASDTVFPCKPPNRTVPVLPDTADQVVGHPDVEPAVLLDNRYTYIAAGRMRADPSLRSG